MVADREVCPACGEPIEGDAWSCAACGAPAVQGSAPRGKRKRRRSHGDGGRPSAEGGERRSHAPHADGTKHRRSRRKKHFHVPVSVVIAVCAIAAGLLAAAYAMASIQH